MKINLTTIAVVLVLIQINEIAGAATRVVSKNRKKPVITDDVEDSHDEEKRQELSNDTLESGKSDPEEENATLSPEKQNITQTRNAPVNSTSNTRSKNKMSLSPKVPEFFCGDKEKIFQGDKSIFSKLGKFFSFKRALSDTEPLRKDEDDRKSVFVGHSEEFRKKFYDNAESADESEADENEADESETHEENSKGESKNEKEKRREEQSKKIDKEIELETEVNGPNSEEKLESGDQKEDPKEDEELKEDPKDEEKQEDQKEVKEKRKEDPKEDEEQEEDPKEDEEKLKEDPKEDEEQVEDLKEDEEKLEENPKENEEQEEDPKEDEELKEDPKEDEEEPKENPKEDEEEQKDKPKEDEEEQKENPKEDEEEQNENPKEDKEQKEDPKEDEQPKQKLRHSIIKQNLSNKLIPDKNKNPRNHYNQEKLKDTEKRHFDTLKQKYNKIKARQNQSQKNNSETLQYRSLERQESKNRRNKRLNKEFDLERKIKSKKMKKPLNKLGRQSLSNPEQIKTKLIEDTIKQQIKILLENDKDFQNIDETGKEVAGKPQKRFVVEAFLLQLILKVYLKLMQGAKKEKPKNRSENPDELESLLRMQYHLVTQIPMLDKEIKKFEHPYSKLKDLTNKVLNLFHIHLNNDYILKTSVDDFKSQINNITTTKLMVRSSNNYLKNLKDEGATFRSLEPNTESHSKVVREREKLQRPNNFNNSYTVQEQKPESDQSAITFSPLKLKHHKNDPKTTFKIDNEVSAEPGSRLRCKVVTKASLAATRERTGSSKGYTYSEYPLNNSKTLVCLSETSEEYRPDKEVKVKKSVSGMSVLTYDDPGKFLQGSYQPKNIEVGSGSASRLNGASQTNQSVSLITTNSENADSVSKSQTKLVDREGKGIESHGIAEGSTDVDASKKPLILNSRKQMLSMVVQNPEEHLENAPLVEKNEKLQTYSKFNKKEDFEIQFRRSHPKKYDT